MSLSEHLFFGERQTGKTTYLIGRMVEDLSNGQDAVYVAMSEPSLDYARSVLRSFVGSALTGSWGKQRIEQHTFGWGRWEQEHRLRRGVHVYIDDADILLGQTLYPVVDNLVTISFNVTWPMQALVPTLGRPRSRLVEVKP